MSHRAVVIGSGASGLAAALALGRLGHEVTVVERSKVLSPLLRGFSRQRRYCDLGLHYSGGLGPDGFVTRLFDRLGMEGVEAVPLDEDGIDRILWPKEDVDLVIPGDMARFESCLSERFPESADAVRAFTGATAEVIRSTPFLNPDVEPWDSSWERYGRVGTADFLRSAGAEESLIQLIGRYGEVLHGVPPEEAPLLTNAIVLGSYMVSAHTVRGGGLAVVKAAQRRLRELGARLIVGRGVEEIRIGSDGRAEGVRLADGELIDADAVIFTPHPAHLPAMLPEGMRATYERRTSRLRNTTGMFMSFLDCVEGEAVGRRNSYLFLSDDEAEAQGRYVAVMAGSPPRKGYKPSLCVIRDLQGGPMMPSATGGVRPEGYAEAKLEMSRRTVELARRHGLVDQQPRELVEAVTPTSFVDWTSAPGGSAYGAKRLAKGRRLNPVTPVDNLLLAGQSLLYPGIMGSFASALVAVGYVAGQRRTWELLLA